VEDGEGSDPEQSGTNISQQLILMLGSLADGVILMSETIGLKETGNRNGGNDELKGILDGKFQSQGHTYRDQEGDRLHHSLS